MPRYHFLNNENPKLTKDNAVELAYNLYNEAKNGIQPKDNLIDVAYEKIEHKKRRDRLYYFVERARSYLSTEKTWEFIDNCKFNRDTVIANACSDFRDVLVKYGKPSQELTELRALLENPQERRNFSIDELANRVKDLLEPRYHNLIITTPLKYVSMESVLTHFDYFASLIGDNLTPDELESLGNEVEEFKSPFEYNVNDELTNPYNVETQAAIMDLKVSKRLDGKEITDKEIEEYEKDLKIASKLFGEPKMKIASMQAEKNSLEKAIEQTIAVKAEERIMDLGFDPNPLKMVNYQGQIGAYEVVDTGKENAFKKNKECEMHLSDDTKANIKEILLKMHEYGFDRTGVTGEQGTKVYGLGPLFTAGNKYKDAIISNNPEERKKAAIYAKEIADFDKKATEIFDLISKNMPVSGDTLTFPGNVDVIRTQSLPAKYRIDYVRSSHFAALNSLANLIEAKKWDIDEFLDNPMKHFRELYKDEYLNHVDPTQASGDLKGVDLLYNLGRNQIGNMTDVIELGGPRMIEGLVHFEKDKDKRVDLEAISQVFYRNIASPYNYVYAYRNNIAKNETLDRLLINPNLKFEDLNITNYDADNLKLRNKDGNGFDEIQYIESRGESLKNVKERLDESILKFMKKESEAVREFKNVDASFIKLEGISELAAKAALKYLTVRRTEKDDPDYQALLELVNNRQQYITNLVNSIPNNPKYQEYQVVKELADNPIVVSDREYNIMAMPPVNKFQGALEEYDTYVTRERNLFKTANQAFINREKTRNTQLKKNYDKYVKANTKYQKEVNRLYGRNYRGFVDNNRSAKLMKLFVERTNAYRKMVNDKNDYLKYIENQCKNYRVPQSYFFDRKLMVENDYYKKMPPLFRSDREFGRNDYIKLKYPGVTLSEEEKNILYDSYKKNAANMENDFFSRAFLEDKGATPERDEEIELGVGKEIEQPHAPINEQLVEAKLLGLDNATVKDLHIGEKGHVFDEVYYLNKHSEMPGAFKERFDDVLLEIIKEYKEKENNPDELAKLPKLESVVDIAQRMVFKYLLITNPEKNTEAYKELNGFLSDGNGYLTKLVNKENERLAQENEEALNINIKDFNIKDHEINKYTNAFKEFDNYVKQHSRESELPDMFESYENIYNSTLENHIRNLQNLEYQLKVQKNQEEMFGNNDGPKVDTREKLREKLIVEEYDEKEKEDNKIIENDESNNIIDNNESNNIIDNNDSNQAEVDSFEDMLYKAGNIGKNNTESEEESSEESGEIIQAKKKKPPKENLEMRIANLKTEILSLKDTIKENVYEYYKAGRIPEYYLNERYKRLDNNNFTLPSFYEIKDIPGRDIYLRNKYANTFNTLTRSQKNDLYNAIKGKAELEKRHYLARRFIVSKNYSKCGEFKSQAYDDYVKNRPNNILYNVLDAGAAYANDEKFKQERDKSFIEKVNDLDKKVINDKKENIIEEKDNIFNNNKKDSIIDDSLIINTNSKKGKEIIEDDKISIIELNESIKNDIKDEKEDIQNRTFMDDDDLHIDYDEIKALKKQGKDLDEEEDFKEIYNDLGSKDNMEGLAWEENRRTNVSQIWAESLRNVMKDRLGEEKYNEEEIDKFYGFKKNEFFDSWVEERSADLRRLFKNDLHDVFEESVKRLDTHTRILFEKEYMIAATGALSQQYYEELFGKHEYLKENIKLADDIEVNNQFNEKIGDVSESLNDFTSQLKKDIDEKKATFGYNIDNSDDKTKKKDIDDMEEDIKIIDEDIKK